MFGLMVEYEASGLARSAFCAERGIKLCTFSYWRTKYLASKRGGDPGFVSLVPEVAVSGVELHYGEIRLCFGPEVGLDYLACLMQKLSGC